MNVFRSLLLTLRLLPVMTDRPGLPIQDIFISLLTPASRSLMPDVHPFVISVLHLASHIFTVVTEVIIYITLVVTPY